MNKRNLEMLAARLQKLGFDADIQYRLSAHCCFAPSEFTISHTMKAGGDECEFFVQCMRGEQGMYDAMSFTAVLRKLPEIPVELSALNEAMSTIDWTALYACRNTMQVVTVEQDTFTAAALLEDVAKVDTEGLLRFRYWGGTPLEALVPGLHALKTTHEISQRFYLITEDPISFMDAFRFLQSNWMARKVNMDKRSLLQKRDRNADKAGSAAGKLLAKRVRPNKKPGGYKE